jgi:hypothetical protein
MPNLTIFSALDRFHPAHDYLISVWFYSEKGRAMPIADHIRCNKALEQMSARTNLCFQSYLLSR